MKKSLLLLPLLFILLATPVLAKSENGNSNRGRSEAARNKVTKEILESQAEIEDKLSITSSTESEVTEQSKCDPEAEWKNHGEYVSCVAKLKLGGQVVSQAARSQVGKTKNTAPSITPSVSPTITPSVSPTATPSVSPTITPSVSPTATPSVTLTPTPGEEELSNTELLEQIKALVDAIKELLGRLTL